MASRLLIGVTSAAALVAAVFLGSCSTGQVGSQTSGPESDYDIPRTADGNPDLNGVWQSLTEASWDIEPHSAQQDWPAGLGIVVDGPIPYQPVAAAKKKENFEQRMELDPLHKCYLPGVPRIVYMPFPFEITQSPTLIGISYEYVHATRLVYTDGSEHPEGLIDFWMGDSRARWEGDTLVVDVANFNDQTWFDRAGNFHSEALHVVERYTPISRNHIEYEAMIEDPKVFTRPWKISLPLYRRMEKDAQIIDYECQEFQEPFVPWYESPGPGAPGAPARQ